MTTTVAIEMVPPRTSLWTRVQMRLSTWGQKIKGVASKFWNAIVRGAKWVANLAPVKWAVSKAKFGLAWAWNVAKGPVGWVAAPILAILVAPKAVAVMLFLVIVLLVVIGFIAFRTYRHLKTITTEEELRKMAADVADGHRFTESAESDTKTALTPTVSDTVNPTETPETRYEFLDKEHKSAKADEDRDRFSEMTARMFLLDVRAGRGGKIKQNASNSTIYRECRRHCEQVDGSFPWNWTVMNRSILNEDKRLRDLKALKDKQLKLVESPS